MDEGNLRFSGELGAVVDDYCPPVDSEEIPF